MMLYVLMFALAMLWAAARLGVLSADRQITTQVDSTRAIHPVGAARTLYLGALVGIDPAGNAKPFEPGDIFGGVAEDAADNASGAAAAINVLCKVLGDIVHTLTGATKADFGKAVYATADDTLALVGHPDAWVGRIVGLDATNTVRVRLRAPNERLSKADTGSLELTTQGEEFFTATGTTASSQHFAGLRAQSALGLGVGAIATGFRGQFDAVAEIAFASVFTRGLFLVSRGITFEATLRLTDIGDAAALDVDWGIGTELTSNSLNDVDHTDMVNLACFHLDGSSANILAQSDDDTTDVAPVDTTIDNSLTVDKKFKIIVRPGGSVEFWIDGVRVLSSTTFAVKSDGQLSGFINMEKTSDDTTAQWRCEFLRVAGAAA